MGFKENHNEQALFIVRQLYKSGGISADEIFNLAWTRWSESNSARLDMISFFITWAESGITDEYKAIQEASEIALRRMLNEG